VWPAGAGGRGGRPDRAAETTVRRGGRGVTGARTGSVDYNSVRGWYAAFPRWVWQGIGCRMT
jgi:hypothetical protein